MEFALGFVLGFLLAYVAPLLDVKRRSKAVHEPTEEEIRKAQKTLREYQNFMSYDGFASDDEDDT